MPYYPTIRSSCDMLHHVPYSPPQSRSLHYTPPQLIGYSYYHIHHYRPYNGHITIFAYNGSNHTPCVVMAVYGVIMGQ